jgi:hypothetical protein
MDIATATADVEPETNTRAWNYYADQINTIWKKGAVHFIQCGQLLIDAKAELAHDAFTVMVKNKLAFDASVARKLVCVANNQVLCAHGHKLPPCWTSLYELSKLDDETLKAKLADGTIHSGMERKHALALKPKSKRTPTDNTDSSSKTTSQLGTAWEAASKEQRREFLDKLDREGLCAAMSAELLANLRDHVIGITIAGASKSSSWAINATDKLHSAMRIAEQQERDDESIGRLIGALRCIALTAERRGITRSDIVIAEGKSRKRKK